MKYREYIQNLQNKEYDLIPGMLSELELEVPKELHGSIMEKIKDQKTRKRNIRYRTFTSVAAVILLFVISVTNIKEIIKNKSETASDNLISNSESVPQRSLTVNDDMTNLSPDKKDKENEAVLKKDETIKTDDNKQMNTAKLQKKVKNSTIKNSETVTAADIKSQPDNVQISTASNAKQINTEVSNNVLITADSKSNELSDNQSFESSNFVYPIDINADINAKSLKTTLLVSSIPLDYVVTIDKNQTDILSFINNNPSVVLVDTSNSIYRIQRQDFNALNDMINNQTKLFNETNVDQTNIYNDSYIKEYIFVKIIVK